QFLENPYRSATPYEAVQAGTRHLKVFMTPSRTDTLVGAPTMWDTTFAFTAGTNYSVITAGFARTGSTPTLQMLVTTDAAPVPPASQFALRVVYAPGSLSPYASGPLDGWVVARGGAALSGAPTFSAVAPGAITGYVNVPVGTYRMAFTAAGTTTPILFQANMSTGVAGDSVANPIGGTAVAGSAMSVIVTSRSVLGSAAPFSFSAILPFTALTTTGTTAADSIATAVTPTPHNLTTSDTVVINGAIQGAYNGTFAVRAVLDATRFTYRTSGVPSAAAATGYPFWFHVRNAASFNGRAISTLTSTGTTATVVTAASHGFVTNDIVTINGASQAEYNGSFAVTVVNATTFTYTTNGTPAATPATGTPVFRDGGVDFTLPNFTGLVDRRPPLTVP
ncbi:MAG: DUF4397 domain-containing protein, partial [bacterium]